MPIRAGEPVDEWLDGKRGDLVGTWSGVNPAGTIVSYVFGQDGSAEIYENGEPVLSSGFGGRVEWALEREGHSLFLNIVFTADSGDVLPTRYVARLRRNGVLVLRSGGPDRARPADTSEGDDPMQIVLTRSL